MARRVAWLLRVENAKWPFSVVKTAKRGMMRPPKSTDAAMWSIWSQGIWM